MEMVDGPLLASILNVFLALNPVYFMSGIVYAGMLYLMVKVPDLILWICLLVFVLYVSRTAYLVLRNIKEKQERIQSHRERRERNTQQQRKHEKEEVTEI